MRYVLVSIGAGLLFGMLDGLIHANPLARRLFALYEPITRPRIPVVTGILIDLGYGFVLAALFIGLETSLPGASGVSKGLSFGALVWFLRVVMGVASEWVMYTVPGKALLYRLIGGGVEMLALGLLFGLALG